jgi:SAM-dependent methyltransferase
VRTGILWRDSAPTELMVNEWESPPFQIAVPGAAMREAASTADLALWYAIGDAWAQFASRLLPDGPANVLDIGCGSGKMARFLAYNPNVSYVGLDIFAPAIAWCQREFTRFPKFRFERLDVHSALYNPGGQTPSDEAELPIADGFADVIIAGSLFTHLLEPAFERYLAEIHRCLKPSGRAFASFLFTRAERIIGDETKIEINRDYLGTLAGLAGLAIVEEASLFGPVAVFARD